MAALNENMKWGWFAEVGKRGRNASKGTMHWRKRANAEEADGWQKQRMRSQSKKCARQKAGSSRALTMAFVFESNAPTNFVGAVRVSETSK